MRKLLNKLFIVFGWICYLVVYCAACYKLEILLFGIYDMLTAVTIAVLGFILYLICFRDYSSITKILECLLLKYFFFILFAFLIVSRFEKLSSIAFLQFIFYCFSIVLAILLSKIVADALIETSANPEETV